MKHVSKFVWALVAGLASAGSVQAQETHHAHDAMQVAAPSPAMAEGEVRKIDKRAGKITIQHGPLPRLQMPGMTMAFRVSDPKMLDQVKVGDKIRFDADQVDGALTVIKMESPKQP